MSDDETVPRKSLSPAEFCDKHAVSLTFYHKLRRMGLLQVTYVPGTRKVIITPKNERDYERKLEKAQNDRTVKLEVERRRQAAVIAGNRAAQSPKHIANIRKAKAKEAAARDAQS